MKERIGMLIGGMVEGMTWLGTFHSIGVKILRNHAELCGLKSGFSILDMDDQLRLLKQLLEAENIDEKRWPARQLATMIDGWKNRGLTPAQVPQAEGYAYGNGLGAKLYADYQARLKIINAADFGDLLLEPLRMFQENPDVLKTYQERFKYMLVDEYQDTNIAQYLWLRLLAQGHKNICCVGDDDQSIYGWAVPKSITSCASKKISPVPKSSALNRIIAPRLTFWALLQALSPRTKPASARRCTPPKTKPKKSNCGAIGLRRRSPHRGRRY